MLYMATLLLFMDPVSILRPAVDAVLRNLSQGPVKQPHLTGGSRESRWSTKAGSHFVTVPRVACCRTSARPSCPRRQLSMLCYQPLLSSPHLRLSSLLKQCRLGALAPRLYDELGERVASAIVIENL